ncbi:MAG: porin family protein [Bacteroidales bacterium]
MKKQNRIVLILIFLFFTIPIVKAQESSGGGGLSINYGIKAGLVSSDFASDFQKLETTESRTSFSGGLFADFKFSKLLGISIEALYVQEGTMRINPDYIYYNSQVSSDGSLTIDRVNSNIIMHNFEAPLLINIYLGENDYNSRIYFGGSFDYIYNVYAKNLLSYNSGEESYVVSERAFDVVSSSFKEYNVGAIIGAGISLDAISIDIRYKFGLMPINNLATYNYRNTYKEDFSTNVLFVSLGLNINKLF